MGLFDFLRPKPRPMLIKTDIRRPKTPRKRRTALDVAIDRRILQLQTENPALFDRVALKKAGLGSDDEPDVFDKVLAYQERMDRHYKKRRAEDEEQQGGWVQEAAKGFGRALGEVAMRYAAQQQGANGAVPAPQAPAQLPPGHAEPQPDGAVNMHVERLISELVQQTPYEAANWLRSQPAPADQVVGYLVRTPDAQIPQLIDQFAAIAPRGANLLRGRADWLIQVAQHLRQAQYNQQNPPLAQSPL